MKREKLNIDQAVIDSIAPSWGIPDVPMREVFAEIRRLRAHNAELLAALKDVLGRVERAELLANWECQDAHIAITKAEGRE